MNYYATQDEKISRTTWAILFFGALMVAAAWVLLCGFEERMLNVKGPYRGNDGNSSIEFFIATPVREATTSQIVAKLDQIGLRPATEDELKWFGISHPGLLEFYEFQENQAWVRALGSSKRDTSEDSPEGSRLFPALGLKNCLCDEDRGLLGEKQYRICNLDPPSKNSDCPRQWVYRIARGPEEPWQVGDYFLAVRAKPSAEPPKQSKDPKKSTSPAKAN